MFLSPIDETSWTTPARAATNIAFSVSSENLERNIPRGMSGPAAPMSTPGRVPLLDVRAGLHYTRPSCDRKFSTKYGLNSILGFMVPMLY
jgi:hypothetical protein